MPQKNHTHTRFIMLIKKRGKNQFNAVAYPRGAVGRLPPQAGPALKKKKLSVIIAPTCPNNYILPTLIIPQFIDLGQFYLV